MAEEKNSLEALNKKLDTLGKQIVDGISTPLKAATDELGASPKEMMSMATENNKAAMAAFNMASRSFTFVKDKSEDKRQKLSEKTKELTKEGVEATKDGLDNVSSTIKNMLSGSPPYLWTLNKIMWRLVELTVQDQDKEEMIAQKQKAIDIKSAEQTKQYRRRVVRNNIITAALAFKRRRDDGKAIRKRDQITFGYFDHLVSLMGGTTKETEEVGSTLERLLQWTKDNTESAFDKKESAMEGKKGKEGTEAPAAKGGMGKGIITALAIIPVAIAGFAAGFVGIITEQLRAIKNFFKGFKLGGKVFAIFGRISKIFSSGSIGKSVGRIGDFFKRIKDFFTNFVNKSKTLTKVFSFMKSIGKVLGRFFLPITIFMGAFEVIKGFIKGFKKDGIVGGIIGAVDGLVDFLIDAPLNMIKDLISWLLTKFGFEDAAASMDAFEFNFSGLLSDAFFGIVNWVRGLFGMAPLGGEDTLPTPENEWSLWDTISNALNSVTTWLSELLSMENLMFALKFFTPWGLVTTAFMELGTWIGKMFNFDLPGLVDKMLPDNFIGNSARSLLGIGGEGGEKTEGLKASGSKSPSEVLSGMEQNMTPVGGGGAAPAFQQFNTSSSQTSKPVFSRSSKIDSPSEMWSTSAAF